MSNADTVTAFAGRLADYMAERTRPWQDESVMREAVHEAVSLVFGDARYDTMRLLGIRKNTGVACEKDAWALAEWRERWYVEAQRAERLTKALNKLAEDAEVAAQGGIHGALIDGDESG